MHIKTISKNPVEGQKEVIETCRRLTRII